jgi:G:T-mismatch repair DNA endonuclease (very short patch repair protein)
VQFIEKNIREDQQALEELLKLGFRATPVTVVDGEVVVGFDRGRIERLLGIS